MPRLFAIPLSPGRVRRMASVLLNGCSTMGGEDVPSKSPVLSSTVIVTVVATELGLTIATAVVAELVSSYNQRLNWQAPA